MIIVGVINDINLISSMDVLWMFNLKFDWMGFLDSVFVICLNSVLFLIEIMIFFVFLLMILFFIKIRFL